MVEHDLAKVGVASSNLVSRSILFLLLLTTFSFAKTITLLPHYCIDEHLQLNADFFGAKEKFTILTIPKTRTKYTVPSLHVKSEFEKHNYSVIEPQSGVITFERFCNLAGKQTQIAKAVLKVFKQQYPCIDANLPQIKALSPLPYDFKSYSLLKVELKNSSLRRKKSSFKAIFKTVTSEKQIYFDFYIDAKVDVFKAKHKLYNDKILSKNDYDKASIKLDRLPSRVITCKMPSNLMTKNYISANSILTMNKFEYKKDVLRGSKIVVYIRDGMLVIESEAKVLQDGNIGDIIKIKSSSGKLFRAKLISKYKAIILE